MILKEFDFKRFARILQLLMAKPRRQSGQLGQKIPPIDFNLKVPPDPVFGSSEQPQSQSSVQPQAQTSPTQPAPVAITQGQFNQSNNQSNAQ